MAHANRVVELRGPTGAPVRTPLLDVGDGVPILMLSGLVGTNRHWAPTVDLVSEHARCLALEIPLLRLEKDDCGVEGVANMLGRFIEDELRGDPPIIAGSSFGGHAAIWLTIERPELVRGLVLAGSSGLAEKPLMDEYPRKDIDWLKPKIEELFFEPASMDMADVFRAHEEFSHRSRARAMIRLSRSCRVNHMGDRLHRIKVPTLVLWGRQDRITPPSAAEQFAELIPGAELEWIEECGHAPMLEKPREFAGGLIGFIERVARPEGSWP